MEETHATLQKGIAMPVENMHTLIGVAYLLAWVLIAQFSFRDSSAGSEAISQRP